MKENNKNKPVIQSWPWALCSWWFVWDWCRHRSKWPSLMSCSPRYMLVGLVCLLTKQRNATHGGPLITILKVQDFWIFTWYSENSQQKTICFFQIFVYLNDSILSKEILLSVRFSKRFWVDIGWPWQNLQKVFRRKYRMTLLCLKTVGIFSGGQLRNIQFITWGPFLKAPGNYRAR